MKPDVILPLIVGLIGTIVGAAVSFAAVWIQTRSQRQVEFIKLGMQIALDDYKSRLDLAEQTNTLGGFPPVAVYLDYHLRLMKLIQSGSIDAEKLAAIRMENSRLCQLLKEADRLVQERTNKLPATN